MRRSLASCWSRIAGGVPPSFGHVPGSYVGRQGSGEAGRLRRMRTTDGRMVLDEGEEAVSDETRKDGWRRSARGKSRLESSRFGQAVLPRRGSEGRRRARQGTTKCLNFA
jgi:hypothetical protein